MYSSVMLSTFILLCNHHHHQFPELFSSCKTETLYLFTIPSPLCPWHPYSTLCFYDFDYFRYLIKVKSYNIYFLCLAFLTYHNVLEVHPCCDLSQNFLPSFFFFPHTAWRILFPRISFIRLNNIWLYVYTIFWLSIHPPMNTWAASTF